MMEEQKVFVDPTIAEPAAAVPTENVPPEAAAAPEAESATAEVAQPAEAAEQPDAAQKPARKGGLRGWWERHKPSRRRLIQVYAALLYNANLKGLVKGDIFNGVTKNVCVPGMNCYSCPAAVGACPLGSLQNALAGSGKRAPYFMLGILLLYGLMLGRMICGFLCPVGLAQDLLYKVKTPKLKKSRVTRILSYFKYVILATMVIGVPLVYARSATAVPGFCKYFCPAGTFGGAVLLLINPANDAFFRSLGGLFTWKMAVLIAIIAASIFIYRAFCRFFCPLGALYGLFNRFALLGIKVDKSKCINCGKCVAHCKMDIKHVGDHECICCGECINVCPTNAIVRKGSRVMLAISGEGKDDGAAEPALAPVTAEDIAVAPKKRLRGRALATRIVSGVLAVALFVGTVVYANVFADDGSAADSSYTYLLVVKSTNGRSDVDFAISKEGGEYDNYVIPSSGSGTAEDPWIISDITGIYSLSADELAADRYYKYNTKKKGEYVVSADGALPEIHVMYVFAGVAYGVYDSKADGAELAIDLARPEGYGNSVGFRCYDFELDGYNGRERVRLSDGLGKVTVINFWATWCGPCVAELPAFERVVGDDVDVVAVHSSAITDDVQAFIKSKGWSGWRIRFAQDSGPSSNPNGDVYTMLGGRNGAYPRTLVLDREGIVRYVFENSVPESTLLAAINSLR